MFGPRPFVLIEDRLAPGAAAQLFRNPQAIVEASEPAAVPAALGRLEAGLTAGLWAAGFLAFELGYCFEPKLLPLLPPVRSLPLLWLGLFEPPQHLTGAELDSVFGALPPPPPLSGIEPGLDAKDYRSKVEAALEQIRAGDFYQVNLTFPLRFRYAGDPLPLYAALRARQPAAHGGVVATPDATILSVSPELFLDVAEGLATARPMKGTTARGADPASDAAALASLRADPKQRAENLMIVDLLRNDLARVAVPGTVAVPELYTVETYPTFHTLTSTVTARLRPGVKIAQILAALFPCGSVAGAPKHRAIETIRAAEASPRGAYTGSVGVFRPDRGLRLSVAIRTVTLGTKGLGSYGVGGGIVADSEPEAEYRECLLKGRVLTGLAEAYRLIETLRRPEPGVYWRLQRHLARLEASAEALGFALDRARLQAALADVAGSGDLRVRIELSRDGAFDVTGTALEPDPDRILRVCLSRERVDPGDPFLRHKTTARALYEREFAAAVRKGFDEVLFLNRRGEVAEASRNTVFRVTARTPFTKLLTPPVESGALPGVLRAELLDLGGAAEAVLQPDALLGDGDFLLGNSLRGLRPAQLLMPPG